MAIAKVQQATGNGSTITLNGVTSGNLLVLLDSFYRTTNGNAEATPTDSNGTFSVAVADTCATFLAGGAFLSTGIFYVPSANSGTHTATPQANSRTNSTFAEFSGIATTTPLDVATSAKTNQGSFQSQVTGTTGATAQADELSLIAFTCGANTGANPIGLTDPVANYTTLNVVDNDSSDLGTFHAMRVLSASGTQSATFNWTSVDAARAAAASIATFKAAYNLARNLPEFIAKGAFSGQATAATPGMPTFNAGDLLVLAQHSANEAIAIPSGYVEVASSPQSTGSAASAGGVRLSVSTRIAVAGDTAPTLTDSGNTNAAQIYSFRGVDTASPIDVQGGTAQAATASIVFPTVTTRADNCLILNLLANDRDAASTTNLSSVANASLTGVTLQHDETVIAGAGGGLALITGVKATAGSSGGTTATNAASVTNASITLALRGSPKIPDWTMAQKSTPLRM